MEKAGEVMGLTDNDVTGADVDTGSRGGRELAGKCALVIGGGGGIGAGVARHLAEAGASIWVADVDFEAAQATVADIRSLAPRCVAVQMDVRSEGSVQSAVEQMNAAAGTIDIMVHSASAVNTGRVTDISLEAWTSVIDLYLTGVFLTTRAVLPVMAAQKFGRIILIGSQMAFGGADRMSHYSAAKAGVHAFAKSVAREVAEDNITCNVVAPGPTETPGLRSLPHEMVDGIRAEVPLHRIGSVDEIAPSVVLLASGGGSFYTGAVLTPCGGHVMP